MIKSLHIRNFQSHKDTELEFSPGVNIIVGTSDSGKTAILRALRWVAWNRPSGDSIRSYWGGETSVEVETKEGTVLRSKDKVEQYQLGISGKKGTTFRAFGTQVPSEVSNFLNFNEINLQSQLDAPFLLSNSSGEVASHFNKVARLDKIDTATSNVNKWIAELKSDLGYKEKQKVKYTEALEEFKHLQKFEIEVEVLEEAEKKLNQLKNTTGKLDLLLYKVNGINEEINDASVKLELEPLINKILERIEKKKQVQEKYHDLNNIRWELHDTGESLKLAKQRADLENDIISLFDKINRSKELVMARNRLSIILNDLYKINADLEDAKTILPNEVNIDALLQLYVTKKIKMPAYVSLDNALKEISNMQVLLLNKTVKFERLQIQFEEEMGDTCILCGQPIKH